MTQETSPKPSTDSPSNQQQEWSVEKWWAEMTKPSRKQNLTQQQRDSRAKTLRLLRRIQSGEIKANILRH